jgi:acetylornithine deacetylase/succinyl-diaminopimelate desuccinylase-like protein
MSQARFAWGTPAFARALAERFDPTVQRVATLAAELCAVPGVSVPATKVDFAPLARAADLASDYARRHGLRVLQAPAEPGAPYPFLAITFAAAAPAVPVPRSLIALIGHLDVVPAQRPEQFEPYLSGDDLYARGAADMKTVVASYMVWMAERQARGGPQPPLVLLLSCCEENGSAQRHHLASALPWLERTCGASVRFAVVGERTGELEWMQPELTLGPICRENRSWRWLRASSERARGLAALQRAARALAHARTTIHRLNEEATPAAKAARQPGLRSGLVNAFCRIAADDAPFAPAAACWLRVERAPGGAMHAAAAQVSQPSLLEALAQVAERAVETFGPARVKLGGVSLGQEDNFNTYDGAGAMTLALAGVTAEQGAAWAAGAAGEGLSIATCGSPPEPAALPSVLGLDLRELLDHQPASSACSASSSRPCWTAPSSPACWLLRPGVARSCTRTCKRWPQPTNRLPATPRRTWSSSTAMTGVTWWPTSRPAPRTTRPRRSGPPRGRARWWSSARSACARTASTSTTA